MLRISILGKASILKTKKLCVVDQTLALISERHKFVRDGRKGTPKFYQKRMIVNKEIDSKPF